MESKLRNYVKIPPTFNNGRPLCTRDFDGCDNHDCAHNFPCVGEAKRRATAAKIAAGTYQSPSKWAIEKARKKDRAKNKTAQPLPPWHAVFDSRTRSDAFAGDGLLRYFLYRLFNFSGTSGGTGLSAPESNKFLQRVVLANEHIFGDCEAWTATACGTFFEATLFRVFERHGMLAAARFIVEAFERASPGKCGVAWKNYDDMVRDGVQDLAAPAPVVKYGVKPIDF